MTEPLEEEFATVRGDHTIHCADWCLGASPRCRHAQALDTIQAEHRRLTDDRDRLVKAWEERDHARFLMEERAEVAEARVASLEKALRDLVRVFAAHQVPTTPPEHSDSSKDLHVASVCPACGYRAAKRHPENAACPDPFHTTTDKKEMK